MGDYTFPVSGVSIPLRITYAGDRSVLHRLFSTFADGLPGIGLLLLRLLTAVALLYFSITGVLASLALATPALATVALQMFVIGAGMLLLVGLWTPVAGTLAAIAKVSIACSRFLSHSGDAWTPLAMAVLGAILAMVGPGAWSVDARLFGRKHIDFPER
jgi:putative oxidoreductase